MAAHSGRRVPSHCDTALLIALHLRLPKERFCSVADGHEQLRFEAPRLQAPSAMACPFGGGSSVDAGPKPLQEVRGAVSGGCRHPPPPLLLRASCTLSVQQRASRLPAISSISLTDQS